MLTIAAVAEWEADQHHKGERNGPLPLGHKRNSNYANALRKHYSRMVQEAANKQPWNLKGP